VGEHILGVDRGLVGKNVVQIEIFYNIDICINVMVTSICCL